MNYEAILQSVERASAHLVANGGRLEYQCWHDERPTILIVTEGSSFRLRVWDRVSMRVRDDVVEPTDVNFRFATEIHFAQLARLN